MYFTEQNMNSCICLWIVFIVKFYLKSGPGFTKGLKQKIVIIFKRKVLTVQEFCHKVKTFFA